jgi:hypothetical protein
MRKFLLCGFSALLGGLFVYTVFALQFDEHQRTVDRVLAKFETGELKTGADLRTVFMAAKPHFIGFRSDGAGNEYTYRLYISRNNAVLFLASNELAIAALQWDGPGYGQHIHCWDHSAVGHYISNTLVGGKLVPLSK